MLTAITRALSLTGSSHKRNGSYVEPDTESDKVWQHNLRKKIEEGLQSMIDDAKKNLDVELVKAPPSAEAQERLRRDYAETVQNVRNLAAETFQIELEREQQERCWAAGKAMLPQWDQALKSEQQAIMSRIRGESLSPGKALLPGVQHFDGRSNKVQPPDTQAPEVCPPIARRPGSTPRESSPILSRKETRLIQSPSSPHVRGAPSRRGSNAYSTNSKEEQIGGKDFMHGIPTDLPAEYRTFSEYSTHSSSNNATPIRKSSYILEDGPQPNLGFEKHRSHTNTRSTSRNNMNTTDVQMGRPSTSGSEGYASRSSSSHIPQPLITSEENASTSNSGLGLARRRSTTNIRSTSSIRPTTPDPVGTPVTRRLRSGSERYAPRSSSNTILQTRKSPISSEMQISVPRPELVRWRSSASIRSTGSAGMRLSVNSNSMNVPVGRARSGSEGHAPHSPLNPILYTRKYSTSSVEDKFSYKPNARLVRQGSIASIRSTGSAGTMPSTNGPYNPFYEESISHLNSRTSSWHPPKMLGVHSIRSMNHETSFNPKGREYQPNPKTLRPIRSFAGLSTTSEYDHVRNEDLFRSYRQQSPTWRTTHLPGSPPKYLNIENRPSPSYQRPVSRTQEDAEFSEGASNTLNFIGPYPVIPRTRPRQSPSQNVDEPWETELPLHRRQDFRRAGGYQGRGYDDYSKYQGYQRQDRQSYKRRDRNQDYTDSEEDYGDESGSEWKDSVRGVENFSLDGTKARKITNEVGSDVIEPDLSSKLLMVGRMDSLPEQRAVPNLQNVGIKLDTHLKSRERASNEEISEEVEIVITRLKRIFEERTEYEQLLNCRDSQAQDLLDGFQRLLDTPYLDAEFRRGLLVAMQRLSTRSGLYPTCYELEGIELVNNHPIAAGSFADIYQGRFKGQTVCLKVIRIFKTSQVNLTLKRFAHEAILWGQLLHPNLLPMYGLYRYLSRPCLVSPWIENGDLDSFLQENPDVSRILLVLDVAAGIAYLHTNDIIHGDLKAANILVNSSGRAYLADFGLSSVSDANILHWTSHSSVASKGGSIRWQAPELFDVENDEVVHNSKASDVYAWSCVCYEVFTGNIPFVEFSRDTVIMLQVKAGARPLRPPASSPAWNSWGLTESTWCLMQECWDTEPSRRPTIQDILSQHAHLILEDSRPIDSGHISPAHFRDSIDGRSNDFLSVQGLEGILLCQKEQDMICKEAEIRKKEEEVKNREAEVNEREEKTRKREALIQQREDELKKREDELSRREEETISQIHKGLSEEAVVQTIPTKHK